MGDPNTGEQLADLQRGLGRIEGKFDAVLAGMQSHEARTTRLDQRLRGVENKQWWMTGASGVLGVLAGYVTHLFGLYPH